MTQDREWPDTICRELTLGRGKLSRNRPAAWVEPERFLRLPEKHGRKLVSDWLQRAWKDRDCADHQSFEPFIYSWICLNGWAPCVTGLDYDRQWLDALLASRRVAADFSRMVSSSGSPLYDAARRFQELWPIFKDQEIREKGVYRWHTGDRHLVIQSYLGAGLTQYQPGCWKRHREHGEPIPVDWPHTLEALYRVRCNLFHGEKGLESEMDARIVSAAFRVLVHFLHDSGYIINRWDRSRRARSNQQDSGP